MPVGSSVHTAGCPSNGAPRYGDVIVQATPPLHPPTRDTRSISGSDGVPRPSRYGNASSPTISTVRGGEAAAVGVELDDEGAGLVGTARIGSSARPAPE